MGLPTIPYDPWFQTSFVPGYDDRYNPLDDMPIATNDRFDMYGSSDAEDAYNPSPEEEIADDYASVDEQEVTMHEKAFKLARSKYNPFAVGGSESIHDFEGGSEKCQKK